MLRLINLASLDAKIQALAEKLEKIVFGEYVPKDFNEWATLFYRANSVPIQADRVKLLGLLKRGIVKHKDMPCFDGFLKRA